MTETLQTAHEIQTIRFKIESIEGTQELLLRSWAPQIRSQIMEEVFAGDKYLPAIYLAVDGSKSQAEIVEALQADGFAVSQPTVSRRLAILLEHGLVEEAETGPRGAILRKKDVVERGLRLSRYLQSNDKRTGD